MIFSISDHIEQIKSGTKTQTRRRSDRYKVGSLLTIQPHHICISFGKPQFQYCLDCDQIVACLEEQEFQSSGGKVKND